MDQVGKVCETGEDWARIKVQKHSSCKSCGRCGLLADSDGREVSLEVSNLIGAREGEFVKIALESKRVVLASIIVYIIPVIALVMAMYTAQQGAINAGHGESAELIGIIAGLGAMALVFGILRALDKKIEQTRKFKPVITAVLTDKELEKYYEEFGPFYGEEAPAGDKCTE